MGNLNYLDIRSLYHLNYLNPEFHICFSPISDDCLINQLLSNAANITL